jgi:hypothetical protein
MEASLVHAGLGVGGAASAAAAAAAVGLSDFGGLVESAGGGAGVGFGAGGGAVGGGLFGIDAFGNGVGVGGYHNNYGYYHHAYHHHHQVKLLLRLAQMLIICDCKVKRDCLKLPKRGLIGSYLICRGYSEGLSKCKLLVLRVNESQRKTHRNTFAAH